MPSQDAEVFLPVELEIIKTHSLKYMKHLENQLQPIFSLSVKFTLVK